MKKMFRQTKINAGENIAVLPEKMEDFKRFAGSCTGVKYPCSYHCKRCFFDNLYVSSQCLSN